MVDEDEPGVSVLLEGGTEESLPELLPPVGSGSPPVTKSSFRSGPSGVVEEELPEDPPEGVELLELDELSELAFDDQCTGANPAYPLISEIKQMYLNAYYGKA